MSIDRLHEYSILFLHTDLHVYSMAAPRIVRWGGGQCIGKWGVNTVKTLKFEIGGAAHPPPAAPMVVPPLRLLSVRFLKGSCILNLSSQI